MSTFKHTPGPTPERARDALVMARKVADVEHERDAAERHRNKLADALVATIASRAHLLATMRATAGRLSEVERFIRNGNTQMALDYDQSAAEAEGSK